MSPAQAFVPTPFLLLGTSISNLRQVYPRRPSTRIRIYCQTEKENTQRRRRRPARKASAFENTIDDLTMKRMGRGTIYYGERASTREALQDEESEEEFLLKPDPVLVAGATGRTGQWISLGLLNQGFNVRSLSRSFGKAEKLFGPSGSNLDVFEGNLVKFDQVFEAVNGSIAVVCAAGAPWWLPGGFGAVDVRGIRNLIDASVKAGTVRRFVLISAADAQSARGRVKRQAEKFLKSSGLPHVIIRAAQLTNEEGGLKTVLLNVSGEDPTGSVSRIDLAQSVCQALVYDRAVSQLNEKDPSGEFDFPDCVISVSNGKDDYVPDKYFWKREFNRISDAHRDRVDTGTLDRL